MYSFITMKTNYNPGIWRSQGRYYVYAMNNWYVCHSCKMCLVNLRTKLCCIIVIWLCVQYKFLFCSIFLLIFQKFYTWNSTTVRGYKKDKKKIKIKVNRCHPRETLHWPTYRKYIWQWTQVPLRKKGWVDPIKKSCSIAEGRCPLLPYRSPQLTSLIKSLFQHKGGKLLPQACHPNHHSSHIVQKW